VKRDLRYEVVYPHPIEKVWRIVTDSDAIAEWLMPNDFEPRVGHKFQFRTKPRPGFDGVVHCEVLEVAPPHRVAYTWRGGGIDTVVTITLSPRGNDTKLVLEHSGFSGARALFVSAMLAPGWKKILHTKIATLLEKGENR
jgi:uncharacterized protein YndB with AHSA1/START domain